VPTEVPEDPETHAERGKYGLTAFSAAQSCYTSRQECITRSLNMSLTISNKGWVVIPAELRKKYNLLPGTEVVIVDYGGVLSIVPALKNPIKQGRGMLKGLPSLTQELLKERAKDRSREESRIK
jgi:AbrB family looped-hinge helix DNA binding protein